MAAQKPSELRQKQPRYAGLQVLRAIACFFVLIYHATLTLSTQASSNIPVWYGGTGGVDIFFVLSGFVMLLSADRLVHRAAGWQTFCLHRLLRLVPLYWMFTLLFLAAGIVTNPRILQRSYFPGWVFGSFFLLPFFGPNRSIFPVCAVGWTLLFEVFFYLVVAVALLLRRNILVFSASVLLLLSAGWFVRQPTWPAAAFYLDPILLEFLLGMLVYRLQGRARVLPAWVLLLLAPLAFAALLAWPLPPGAWRVVAQGIPAAVIVYAFAALERYFDRVPAALLFLGDASYALYLGHVLVIEVMLRVLLRERFVPNWLGFLSCIVLSLALACALRRYVELPLYQFLRGSADRWMARRAAESSTTFEHVRRA